MLNINSYTALYNCFYSFLIYKYKNQVEMYKALCQQGQNRRDQAVHEKEQEVMCLIKLLSGTSRIQ